MPRRGNVPKREILPDPMYNSVLVTKLINSVMLDGKKGVAQKVVYDAFDIIKEKTGKEPLDAFTEAMNNIMPSLETPDARPALADRLCPQAQRKDHEGAPRRRDHGCLQQHRRCCEEARRHAQDGRVQQGVRTLPLVIFRLGAINYAQTIFP